AVSELKLRLDDLSERRGRPSARGNGSAARAEMAALLAEADHMTLDDARERQYAAVVAQLSPEQAKMLAVLATPRSLPLIHVGAGSRAGPIRYLVLENVTNLGREAGVILRDQVPRLVGHLRTLGLVALGPPVDGMRVDYDLLLADTAVRQAVAHVRETLGMRARLQRHSLALSDFGRTFWQAVGPTSGTAPGDRPQLHGGRT
ncbi:MAG: Abi-alpha family protein, partial [Salinisphaera sp.]|nr:Abi-alpha family protein [Salinisphaera sp.]